MAQSDKGDLNGVILDFIDDCAAVTVEWPKQEELAIEIEERFASQEEAAA